YQRQKLVVYINALPEQREFQLCDPSLDDTGWKSATSAWQNALKPDSTRVWLRYDLHFMMQMAKESGVRLPKMKGLQSQVAVDWGVPEQVSGQTRYDETGEMVQHIWTHLRMQ
ncbi:hypothetical protein JS85_24795, partial [Vibrio vulnificus]